MIPKNLTMKLLYLILIFIVPSTYALTLQELINSYNFGYNDGTLSINLFNDYMIDSNSNGQNDTLMINLTINSTKSDFFEFFIDLSEETGTLSNRINQSIASGVVSVVNLSFDTRILTKDRYNYSVRIYNSSNVLVFSKYNVETNIYRGFDNGTRITKITDEKISYVVDVLPETFLRVNLTINATQNQSTNVTAYIMFNGTIISATQQAALTNGSQIVSIDFDGDTIKSTRNNDNFTLDSVSIGKKLIRPTYITHAYNFSDFAKTSYIKNYSSAGVDTNANDCIFCFKSKFHENRSI